MSESSNYSLKETALRYGDADPLAFPDWRGQLPHRSRVSNDQWLDYCRSNLPKLRQHPGHAQQRQQNGIAPEFVL